MQEESKNKKEKWGKPKLIILARTNSAERILVSCKGGPTLGPQESVDGACILQKNCVSICSTLFDGT